MGSSSTTQTLARASAAISAGVDSVSTVHVLLADCARLLGACSAAVLVRVGDRALELLASTSHVADELEMLEAYAQSGPSVTATVTGSFVDLATEEVDRTWAPLGVAMRRIGVVGLHAAPMRWRGHALGSLSVFWGPEPATSEAAATVQAFADVATIALMQSSAPTGSDVVADRLETALESRVPIERAKGLIAQLEGVDVATAFDLLVERSERDGGSLVRTARRVLDGSADG
ncbi:GAF and ANTAR domain-containing protein [Solicola sp. PLA-1-18]|uniref:GAF and ANTAR domain-containing protein n=1 Tax=Solicola sp. PLA-1-18 TaxID=3380532 RepID=UPI003B7F0A6C